MAIIEIGVVKNGVLVFSKPFYRDAEIRHIALEIRGQIISAIHAMADQIEGSEFKFMVMRHYRIGSIARTIEGAALETARGAASEDQETPAKAVPGPGTEHAPVTHTVVFYLISDAEFDLARTRFFLNQLVDRFLGKYAGKFQLIDNASQFEEFEDDIWEVLGDVAFRPLDRLKTLF